MKTIGIIAAMDEEIAEIKGKMEISVTKTAIGADFYIGSLTGKSVVLVKCGVGKVNAAIITQALIDLFAVDYVINTGVAGGINRDIKIGDIIISTEAIQHDFDCTALGEKIGVIPWQSESVFAADETMVSFAKRAAGELSLSDGRSVYAARIASGDVFVASKEKKKEIWDNVSAYCAEMEGAAIAQACRLNKIPFVIIRAVSDNADGSGNSDFREFVVTAAGISSALTQKIIEYI